MMQARRRCVMAASGIFDSPPRRRCALLRMIRLRQRTRVSRHPVALQRVVAPLKAVSWTARRDSWANRPLISVAVDLESQARKPAGIGRLVAHDPHLLRAVSAEGERHRLENDDGAGRAGVDVAKRPLAQPRRAPFGRHHRTRRRRAGFRRGDDLPPHIFDARRPANRAGGGLGRRDQGVEHRLVAALALAAFTHAVGNSLEERSLRFQRRLGRPASACAARRRPVA